MIVGPFVILGVIVTLVWAAFQPNVAPWAFIAIFIALFEGYIALLLLRGYQKSIAPLAPPFEFTSDEVQAIKRYSLFFESPQLSRECSSAISLLGLSTFAWVPWLLYQSQWVPAIIIGLNYLVAGPLSLHLNPMPFLQRGALSQNNPVAVGELRVVESIIEKITRVQNQRAIQTG